MWADQMGQLVGPMRRVDRSLLGVTVSEMRSSGWECDGPATPMTNSASCIKHNEHGQLRKDDEDAQET